MCPFYRGITQVANFLVGMVVDGQNVSTATRCVYAISHIHKAGGFENPTASELVRQVRRGLRKEYGQPPVQSPPIEINQIRQICGSMSTTDWHDIRDRALVTVGFFGAFRRSELVSLTLEQLVSVDQGLEVHLLRSKTNKFGEREVKPLVRANDQTICPIHSLAQWIHTSGITSGPLFRNVTDNQLSSTAPITSQTLYNLLKKRAANAGIDPGTITPHGLRAGFVTTAFKAGKDRYRIKQVTGHKSDAMLDCYIRGVDKFTDCAGRLD
jgi:integrase